MFGFLLDKVQGMQCPACGRRGLFAIKNAHRGFKKMWWSVARCRRCNARCIANRYHDETFREATDAEWGAHALEELPTARVR